jgi:hypothetical protein
MTTAQLHASPPVLSVAREQIRAVWLQLRILSGLLLVALLLYAAVAVRAAVMARDANAARHYHSAVDFSFTPQVSMIIMLIALMVPSIIWNGEDPTRRMYHWSMPVGRAAHAWIKTAAGWLWTMGLTLAFMITVVVVDALVGHIVGQRAPADPGFRTWEWAVPFTATTVAYVLASAAAVGTRTPVVWIAGPFTIYTAATLLVGATGYPALSRSMMKVISGYYGISAAIAGTIGMSDDPKVPFHANVSQWLGATALWGLVGLVLLYLVAHRRPE